MLDEVIDLLVPVSVARCHSLMTYWKLTRPRSHAWQRLRPSVHEPGIVARVVIRYLVCSRKCDDLV